MGELWSFINLSHLTSISNVDTFEFRGKVLDPLIPAGDVVIDVIMYAETRAAIVHFDFQCNKVDTVRLYASYRLNYFS